MASSGGKRKRGREPATPEPYAEAENITPAEMLNSKTRLRDGNLLVVAKHYKRTDIAQQWQRTTDTTDTTNKTVSTSAVSHAVTNALKRKALHEGLDYESIRKEYDAEDRAPHIKVRTSYPIPIDCLDDIDDLEDLAASEVYKHKKRRLPLAFYIKLWEVVKKIDTAEQTLRVKEAFGHATIGIAANLILEAKGQVLKKDGGKWTMSDIPDRTLQTAPATPSAPNQDPTTNAVPVPAPIGAQDRLQPVATPRVTDTAGNTIVRPPPPARKQIAPIQRLQGRSMYPPPTSRPITVPNDSSPADGGAIGHGDNLTGETSHARRPFVAYASSANTIPFLQAPPMPYTPFQVVSQHASQSTGARAQVPPQPPTAQHNFQVNEETAQREFLAYNNFRLSSIGDTFASGTQAQTTAPLPAFQPTFQVNKRPAKRQRTGGHISTGFYYNEPYGHAPAIVAPALGAKKRVRTSQGVPAVVLAVEPQAEDLTDDEDDLDAAMSAIAFHDEEDEPDQRTPYDFEVSKREGELNGVLRFRNALRDPAKHTHLDALASYCHDLYPSGSKASAELLLKTQTGWEDFCEESFLHECPHRALENIAAEIITEWLEDASINEHLLQWVEAGLNAYREELLSAGA
ncbi:uncharacterized protein CLAFUR5_12966 [Fulvia fulva]|uniref:Uncharacterized protein n=1 Tax=Passalora fulva TaxID=5499 RepID=A0A9Q8UV16_PASFU|nr:uncharacterized protein CLAFUR5_12966 [Fulvia fulva]UJO23529.1 hypothetical protein CLAFUR5_12966 [Fulvia fulva]WPV36145.1 hypothetical protein CLAFUW7_13115 [Fulvia fulva]